MLLTGIGNVQTVLLLVLGVAAFAVCVWALVQAARFRKDAYPAAGKQTKTVWVSITAVATVLSFIFITNPITGGNGSFLSIIGDAACIVFHVSVVPALRQVSGGRGGRSSGGPYGGW